MNLFNQNMVFNLEVNETACFLASGKRELSYFNSLETSFH